MRFATDAPSLVEALPGAEVLLVWDFTSDAVRDAWPAADTLRWVHTASAGVDRLTFPGLLESEVTLTNSRGVFDRPMAEYVLGLVLAMAKDLPGTLAAQARREWHHRETESIAGRRAVVVGGGPIGRAIAGLLGAVGMDVDLVGRRDVRRPARAAAPRRLARARRTAHRRHPRHARRHRAGPAPARRPA